VNQTNDKGYALIAALAAMLAFSLLAFEVLAASRGNVATAGAELERARLQAAADAGIAAAIAGLDTDDRTKRWAIDGRARAFSFDGIALTLTIEDERGKVPINILTEEQFGSLIEAAGVTDERRDVLVDSFEDWIDDDSDRRDHGAEAGDYASLGIRPRNGAIRTADELMLIRGMDENLYRQIAPALTLFFGESGGFSPSTANPLALAVMSGMGEDSPEVIARVRELSGERSELEIADAKPLTGRTLTVRVTASDGSYGRLARSAIVELTGNDKDRVWIRWQEN
jgi:general secretion pathway protein K